MKTTHYPKSYFFNFQSSICSSFYVTSFSLLFCYLMAVEMSNESVERCGWWNCTVYCTHIHFVSDIHLNNNRPAHSLHTQTLSMSNESVQWIVWAACGPMSSEQTSITDNNTKQTHTFKRFEFQNKCFSLWSSFIGLVFALFQFFSFNSFL